MKARVWQTLVAGVLFAGAHAQAQTSPAAIEVRVVDDRGEVLATGHAAASLSRTLPAELSELPGPDHDALRFLLIAVPDAGLEALDVVSLTAQGRPIDVVVNFRAQPTTCPDGVAPELVCRQTPPLRLVGDALERSHSAVKFRSLRAELGGAIRLSLGRRKLLELPVAGPRRLSGARLDRLRARLRVLVLRAKARGAPAIGGSDAGARQLMQTELGNAASIWAQCGVDLGQPSIEVVDPPTRALINVGCGVGQAASGGVLRLGNGRRRVAMITRPGESPIAVALRLAELLGADGVGSQVFENQRTAGDALASADVLLTNGREWHAGAEPLSTDPTLTVCLGRVDLSDGLTHFGDGDAFAGTLEERALLRAFDDGDPRTVEVLVVPGFEGSNRIGESFIVSPGSSLSSSVILDRSAIAAGARSFALAHELGHVFMAMPGHPDDFGVDQSWSLMDADVADGTVFGPRRLSLADCERAVTQSGPASLIPVLHAIPAP